MFDFIKNAKIKKENIEIYYNDLLRKELSDEFLSNQDNNLLNLYDKVGTINTNVKILMISNTNNTLDELRFADYVYRSTGYDACIIIGNVSDKDFQIILKYVDVKKIYSTCNHKDINNIDGKLFKIKNMSFLIISEKFISQRDSISYFNDLPAANTLITYNNKYENNNGGLFGINYYLYKNKTNYFIHYSSLNKQYKSTMQNGTMEISTYDYEYIELNK